MKFIEMKSVLPQKFDAPLNVGRKDDTNKPRFDLIDPLVELQLAAVLEYGARKYGDENWRKLPDLRARYLAASLRHLNSWRCGEELDPESGLPHLAHALASIHFILADSLKGNK